eukprot:CAMPEP_0197515006 /NCGR_PEP_ID=MMETSP1318-20131121/268_1 /TAXON_ID=552666 /ORGANISM="Partenskyella glossopodia, Strain RCC365" /LENGTH=375 /DNA_ID=CAMNT_0043063253 /DNA_START=3 /DNA_END=1130 /DNA_ORIENTATION=-
MKKTIQHQQQQLNTTTKKKHELEASLKRALEQNSKLKVDSDALRKLTDGQRSWRLMIRSIQKNKSELQTKLQASQKALEADNADKKTLAQLEQTIQTLKQDNQKLNGLVASEVVELSSSLEEQKDLVKEMESELDEMGESYDFIEEDNRNLKEQLKDAEKERFKMYENRDRLQDSLRIAKDEKKLLVLKASAVVEQLKEKSALNRKLDEAVVSYKKEGEQKLVIIRDLQLQIEALRRSANQATMDKEKLTGLADQKSQTANSLQKQVQKLQEKHNQLTQAKIKMEKEIGRQKKKLMLFRKGGGEAYDKDLKFQLDSIQRRIKCELCSENEKSVCITRCMHMFCRKCIDKALGVRNRNCPSCAKSFSKSDVKDFWL